MRRLSRAPPAPMADDDPDDRLFARLAWEESRLAQGLALVEDFEELMDYLGSRGRWAHPALAPRPGLVLPELNMPRMDGREALRAIRSDPGLRRIPVAVLSTSSDREEVAGARQSGANSFITKPTTFEALVEVMRALGRCWLEIVELPVEGPTTAGPTPPDGDAGVVSGGGRQ